jgi:molecular chaperone DnaJ
MDTNKNYYRILGLDNTCSKSDVKKTYYKLSMTNHPDRGGSVETFNEIREAYGVLFSDQKEEYDKKSRFGSNYNEYYELFDTDQEMDYEKTKSRVEKFKTDEILNVKIEVGEDFNGTIEYPRYVKCKDCGGSGKDMVSKIEIKDVNGKVIKTFDAIDGCDFCEGTGKDGFDNKCYFCAGSGQVGLNPCKTCKGDRRLLGKQKLNNIKLTQDETKIDAMGHFSKHESGRVGYLLIVKV